jgi:hypothetical protein
MLVAHEEVRMKIEIITSFNQRYYDMIGKECVETFLKFWPAEYSLTCYVEEFELPPTTRINQISFDKLGQDYINFQNDQKLNGREKIFGKKAYSIIHALKNSTSERIIWIDADVITENHLPKELLLMHCPSDTLLTYMRVTHHMEKGNYESKTVPSAESGFFIVNAVHKDFKSFANRYEEYYNNRIRENLRRFYDGDVLGAVAQEFEKSSKIIDLCKDFTKPYKTPLKHIQLGKFLHHYKAKSAKELFTQLD